MRLRLLGATLEFCMGAVERPKDSTSEVVIKINA